MGAFDHLIPKKPNAKSGMFSHLIPGGKPEKTEFRCIDSGGR